MQLSQYTMYVVSIGVFALISATVHKGHASLVKKHLVQKGISLPSQTVKEAPNRDGEAV